MSEREDFPEGISEEELSPEVIDEVERLTREYGRHQARHIGSAIRPKPFEEVVEELKETLGWLQVGDVESASNRNIRNTGEVSLYYSAYDIEDTFFIVYGHLKGRREVTVEDVISEHRETNLRKWQERQTREAADFLVIHGADENQINLWKSVEGSARQQRAMRRMHWLLSEPYMSQFKDFLKNQATAKQVYNFTSLALKVNDIITEGQANNDRILTDTTSLIPRRREDLETEREWLILAGNICEHVFDKDIEDGVYAVKR